MFYRIAFSTTLMLLLAGCSGGEPLEVSEARVREVIPGQDRTAAYFTARNRTDQPIVLVGADSDQIRSIELHATSHDGDVVRMRHLPEVEIAAGGTVRFEPGGLHLMLFGVAELEDSLEIVLETADGRRFPVRFEAVPIGADH